VILPDSFIVLDHMMRRFTRIVRGMVVYPERMLENLNRSRGVVFAGTVLLELAKKGVSREQAYEWVQRNAMRSFSEQRDFKALLVADADVTRVLTPQEIEKAFDLDEQLKHVHHIFDRVFNTTMNAELAESGEAAEKGDAPRIQRVQRALR
jgi:adenylosuccinate lyase